ncbi:MAG: zf-HC2 domain-containing protein [Thermoflexales bacterium]|nr:zf-HC2 domain-containing protein [Thermoflexales bacterium]
MTHTHDTPGKWAAAYYDGELDEAGRQAFELHLAGCPGCQRELEALQALSSMLAGGRSIEGELDPWAAFWSKLEPHLSERTAAPATLATWLAGLGLLLINGLIQLGAVASLLVVLMAGRAEWLAGPVAWLSHLASRLVFGWLTWLLPPQWSGLGLALFFVELSVLVAVLYLAWLGAIRRSQRLPAMSTPV